MKTENCKLLWKLKRHFRDEHLTKLECQGKSLCLLVMSFEIISTFISSSKLTFP